MNIIKLRNLKSAVWYCKSVVSYSISQYNVLQYNLQILHLNPVGRT